jgi:hypothetical protein
LLVLVEGRGTCSSKHAVLVELADEIGLDVRLTPGIFEMSARTHPELTTILERHGLDHVPEAHCYVRHRGRRTKIEVHRRLLAGWIARTATSGSARWRRSGESARSASPPSARSSGPSTP